MSEEPDEGRREEHDLARSHYRHLLRATQRISGAVMWANLHLLFWLSLIPVATKWVGQAHQASLPASAYGIASFGSAVALFTVRRGRIAVVRA